MIRYALVSDLRLSRDNTAPFACSTPPYVLRTLTPSRPQNHDWGCHAGGCSVPFTEKHAFHVVREIILHRERVVQFFPLCLKGVKWEA